MCGRFAGCIFVPDYGRGASRIRPDREAVARAVYREQPVLLHACDAVHQLGARVVLDGVLH